MVARALRTVPQRFGWSETVENRITSALTDKGFSTRNDSYGLANRGYSKSTDSLHRSQSDGRASTIRIP